MVVVHEHGGIWADVGDTEFPRNFHERWAKHNFAVMPHGFRVAFNHSGPCATHTTPTVGN